MIGYVQTDTATEWSERIKDMLRSAPRKYDIVEPIVFPLLGVFVPEPVFCSQHGASVEAGKRITHALLLCA